MAQLPENFIGLDALQHVAEQVSKEIFMGPGYSDPNEMDRLGIDIVSGIQFKRVFHLLLRKGGTTRRKDVHKQVNSVAGYLKERVLVTKLAWDHFESNVDAFTETVFGTDAQGQFPLSTEATEAVLKDYADNLAACLWYGDIELDNGDDSVKASDQALALYDGFHTVIKHDIEDGLISEANGNYIKCDGISAPADNNDSTPYDNFIEWHRKWDARLRKQETYVYMSEETANNIAAGYANKFHGNFKVDYNLGDNFKLPGLSKVTICPVADFGEGDRMYATVAKNFVYGVDTESNQSYVGVKVGTDDDMRDIQFQIQSIQGAGIKNPFKSAFCMSDGSLASTDFIAGDYTKAVLAVSVVGKGTVAVNGVAYSEPVEINANDVITLKATAQSGATFKSWSNGKTDAEIQITASGMPIGITAFFE